MELRPGFRQTEVGTIPEDWEITTIQELLARRAIVGHLDGNHGELYPRSHEFTDWGIPYITANDLTGHNVSFGNCKHLSEERARRFRKGVAKSGDVLFAHNATVGPTALLTTNLEYVILSTTATYFRCNPEKLVNSFLLYMLQSALFATQYRSVMAQSTRNQVPITAQRKLCVVLPPDRAEQEAIAVALSDADALVETLEQLLVKKRNIKQGAMQNLLTGKERLPGFRRDDQSYRQTKFGRVPAEWTQISLQQMSTFITKGSTPTTYGFAWQKEGILFLRSECVSGRGLDLSQSMFISDSAHKTLKRSEVRAGDILITITGNVGRVIYLRCDFGKANINQHIARIRIADPRVADAFVVHFLSQEVVRNYYNLITTGQAYPQISLAQVRNTEVPLPSLAEQRAIAAVLSDMDAEITTLEDKLAKTRHLKQGMMQELLTGRIRLV
jgi:type I restriction enzyme S subunit